MELAKQATAQFSTVNIRLGDIMNMPYNDNTFDIALSIYVTCELPMEVISKHFKELHRVLVPIAISITCKGISIDDYVVNHKKRYLIWYTCM